MCARVLKNVRCGLGLGGAPAKAQRAEAARPRNEARSVGRDSLRQRAGAVAEAVDVNRHNHIHYTTIFLFSIGHGRELATQVLLLRGTSSRADPPRAQPRRRGRARRRGSSARRFRAC